MRLGIDCRMFSSRFTGIGRYTYEIVQYIIDENSKKQEPDEILLFMNNPEYSDSKIKKPHVKKILVNAKHYSFAEQSKYLWELKKQKPAIMLFPHFNVPFFYRKPYIATIHDLTLSFFPGKKLTRFYHRWAYKIILKNTVKTAKNLIAVSENTKKDIQKYLKTNPSKIKVIYNGISDIFNKLSNPREATSTLKKFNIKQPFLLYTGVWRNHKNIPRMIEAFKIVKGQIPELKLVIGGKENPLYSEIKDTVKKLNLNKEVIFTGHVSEEELNHLLNSAKIYVFPSLYEGFGLPPLEAMKCGTPVATAFSSSIPEICGKDNAIFFNPYSVKDIANKIIKLYFDEELRNKLKENGLKHAEKFSWKKSARQTYELIVENGKNPQGKLMN